MKKLLSVLLVVLMAASLVFAGGSKESAGPRIRVLSMTAQISDGILEYLDEFEKESGIKVDLELYGEAELRQKEMTEFMTGNSTVDVYLFSPLQDMAAFSQNGWIEPLDEYLDDPELNWDDFSSAPPKQITIPGTDSIGCLPLYSSVQLMYYRTDVFEKYGIEPPKNYDELIEVCKTINDPANNFYAIACRGERNALTSQYSPFLFAFGGSFIKDGKSNFASEGSYEATKFYGELLGNYAPPGILTAGYSQMTQLFNSGTVGMVIDANALYATLVDPAESAYADKVGVAAIPAGPEGAHSYMQVSWAVAMYPGSKNKEAAWEFMKFVAGSDVAAYITPLGMPSFRNSVWTDERVESAMTPDMVQAYADTYAITTNNEFGLPRMTAVTDRHSAYFALNFLDHQVCLAHLLRECQFLNELDKGQQWSKSVESLLQEAIHERNGRPQESIDTRPWLERLDRLMAENLSKLNGKFTTFKNGLLKCRDYIFNFLQNPAIPPDNNASERGIRKLKIKLKNSGCFRSDLGADAFMELHSIVETTKKHGNSPYNVILALF